MWRIKESILEFQLTYLGERLDGNGIAISVLKSIKAFFKCLLSVTVYRQGGFNF